jgi:hypothetical protein
MKTPPEVFFEVYEQARAAEEHDIAVIKAFAASIFDLQSRGLREYQDVGIRFKLIADAWDSEGAPWSKLAERLRHDWTDWQLANRSRT